MQRRLSLLPLLLLLACGGEQGPAADPSGGDPAKATYAPSLGVDLAAMEKRPSGLYLQDLTVGTGAAAGPNRYATVHYTGWLTDGTQFDSSRERGPFRFVLGVGDVIPGWDEGVVGMRVGGTRKLVIPSNLAYGPRGRGPIPPDAVLVFDVELVGVD